MNAIHVYQYIICVDENSLACDKYHNFSGVRNAYQVCCTDKTSFLHQTPVAESWEESVDLLEHDGYC